MFQMLFWEARIVPLFIAVALEDPIRRRSGLGFRITMKRKAKEKDKERGMKYEYEVARTGGFDEQSKERPWTNAADGWESKPNKRQTTTASANLDTHTSAAAKNVRVRRSSFSSHRREEDSQD